MGTFYDIAEKTFADGNLIRLNVGDTHLPAPCVAIEAARKSLQDEKATYGPASGILPLREAIAERERCHPDQVVVGPGSKHLLFGLMSILRGNVLVPSPTWPAYVLIAKHLGLGLEVLPSTLVSQWCPELPRDRLRKDTTFILCNPLNPTSTIYPADWVDELVSVGAQKGATLIVDEAYRDIAFRPIPSLAVGPVHRLRSFSKEFNLEGWRLGYAIVPADMAEKLQKFLQLTSTCVPIFIQRAGIACLEHADEILETNREIWRKRAEAMTSLLRSNGFLFAEPEAGMYLFLTHPAIGDGTAYAARLLDLGVAVAPGKEFGEFPGFVRVCFNQPEQTLMKAVAVMASSPFLPLTGGGKR